LRGFKKYWFMLKNFVERKY
jgi:hypothetical protein